MHKMQDVLKCRSLSAKEPRIIGLFCGKWPIKRKHPMRVRHTVLIGKNVYCDITHSYIWQNPFPCDKTHQYLWNTGGLLTAIRKGNSAYVKCQIFYVYTYSKYSFLILHKCLSISTYICINAWYMYIYIHVYVNLYKRKSPCLYLHLYLSKYLSIYLYMYL